MNVRKAFLGCIALTLFGTVHAHMMSPGLLGVQIEPKQLKLVASIHHHDLTMFDDDGNGVLTPHEVNKHHANILDFLRQKIILGFLAPQKKLKRNIFFLSNDSLMYQQIYVYDKAPAQVQLNIDFGQWKIIVKKGDNKRHAQWPQSHVSLEKNAPLIFNF